MKERKVNVGWKKCSIFEHFNVKRCFKCWDYYHIAKYCTKEVRRIIQRTNVQSLILSVQKSSVLFFIKFNLY